MIRSDIAHRSETAVAAVLPPSVRIRRGHEDGHSVDLELNGEPVRVTWLGEGGLRQARELIAGRKDRPDVAVARFMSPGAREALSAAGIGWVDETGAAEIARGSLIVSRSGRPPRSPRKPPHWTPAVLAVAEALLCGGRATVGAMQETTALSAGGATNALRTLTDLGLLNAEARRGRNAARRIPDPERLLNTYAAAAAALVPTISLTVGVTWRDPVAGLTDTGRRWDRAGISWAATGHRGGGGACPLSDDGHDRRGLRRRKDERWARMGGRERRPAANRRRAAHPASIPYGHGRAAGRSEKRVASRSMAPRLRRSSRRRRAGRRGRRASPGGDTWSMSHRCAPERHGKRRRGRSSASSTTIWGTAGVRCARGAGPGTAVR